MHHWRCTSCSGAIEITLTLPISGLSTCNYFRKKSSSTNFLRKVSLNKFSAKNQPGVPMDRPSGLRKSRDSNAPMMRFNPKLSYSFVTPFRDFSVLCCFSLCCFDFANGSKCVARVCSTSGRDGRFYQKHKLNCQINC